MFTIHLCVVANIACLLQGMCTIHLCVVVTIACLLQGMSKNRTIVSWTRCTPGVANNDHIRDHTNTLVTNSNTALRSLSQ
jgi:hypothetical protein